MALGPRPVITGLALSTTDTPARRSKPSEVTPRGSAQTGRRARPSTPAVPARNVQGVIHHKNHRRFLWVLDHTLNRITTPLAKSGHGPFSLIRHVGRKTGQAYETPVILATVPEGFVAELTTVKT